MENTNSRWPLNGTDHKDISRKSLYTTGAIDRFLDGDSVTVLIASKGMGKTLLLRTKKKLIEDHSHGELTIPRSAEYDEPKLSGDLPHRYAKSYRTKEYWRDIWKLAILLSVFSHTNFSNLSEDDFDDIWQSLDDIEIAESLKMLIDNSISKRQNHIPSYYLGELVDKAPSVTEKLRRHLHVFVDLSTRFIHTSVNVFIDAFDQTLTDKFNDDLEVWRNGQLGLLLAVHHLFTENHHLKVYASIRQEAFAGLKSDDKEVLRGRSVFLEYSKRDLKLLFTKAIERYGKARSVEEFLGIKWFRNSVYGLNEDPFDYIYRHSSGTPRSLMWFGRKLSDVERSKHGDAEVLTELKSVINEVSATQIYDDYLRGQRQIFLSTLGTDEGIMSLLKNLCANILDYHSITEISERVAADLGIEVSECHPFCELLNVGLLGELQNDPSIGSFIQEFRKPSRFDWRHNGILNQKKVYFVHPGLHYRARQENPDYFLIKNCLVGDGCPWPKTDPLSVLPSVFVSHSSNDKPVVERFIKAFRKPLSLQIPHRVWYDAWSIRFGEDIHQEVERGVEDSDLVLLCLTKSSLSSNWVQKEWRSKHYDEISDNCVKIVVVILDDTLHEDIPKFLQSKRYLRVDTSDLDAVHNQTERLVTDIASALRVPHVIHPIGA